MTTTTSTPSLFRLLAARSRRIATAGTLAMFGLVSAGTAVAAPATIAVKLEPRLVGATHWTSAAGQTNAIETILAPRENPAAHAARGFVWTERSDSPCWAEVFFRPLGDSAWSSAVHSGCKEHKASKKSVYRSQANEVVTGIEVCLTKKRSSSKNRLKGVRLWGRTIDPETGALGPLNGPSEDKRTHCADWTDPVFCPSGEVAAKFKVFSASNDTRPYMQGISLGCRDVAMRPATRPATVLPPT